jgi:hypothetical protein
MELDITEFVTDVDAFQLSASAAEMGQNAGKITWANSKAEAARAPLLTTPEALEKARVWLGEFGAWDDEEIAAWSEQEVNALVIQFIAGNLREIESLCMGDDGEIDWAKAEELSSEGRISGGIYPGDDGRFYFWLGS